MRVLFCSPNPLTAAMGAPKVLVEAADALRAQGWSVDLMGCGEVCERTPAGGHAAFIPAYQQGLRRYLQAHASRYDVVDYDHGYLPFAREEFCPTTLFVARSVLLIHHQETIIVPTPEGLRAMLGRAARGRQRRALRAFTVTAATRTLQQADLVNVSNHDDKAELLKRGIEEEKIVVLPYGISAARRALFDQIACESPADPLVAFVGTFDYRKGAKEFPFLVSEIVRQCPQARFKLMGVKGMFPTAEAVAACFPPALRARMEIVPAYKPDALPALLADCSLGVFPSYMEGFPFGVLEMLAACVPVIAYDAPGATMMLDAAYLVPRGDAGAMSRKAAALLADATRLAQARVWAQARSRQFDWAEIAQRTAYIYRQHWERKQVQPRPPE